MLLAVALAALIGLAAPGEIQDPAAPAAYEGSQAERDLDALLHSRGSEYSAARARLEANPPIAAPLAIARLAASPAPGPAERQRLLVLLGTFNRPEDLQIFAGQLKRDVASVPPSRAIQSAAPWRDLLRQSGAQAHDHLMVLVGDRELPEDVRALLLADLVAIESSEGLVAFAGMIGQGSPGLRVALRQALLRRAQASRRDRAALIAALDASLEGAAPAPRAALLGLRAALTDGDDPPFNARLTAWAEAEDAPFVVRAAALRLLAARPEDPQIHVALTRLAAAHLPAAARGVQLSEVIAWLALTAVEPAHALPLVQQFKLDAADSPRLASLAYTLAPASPSPEWLDGALNNPWPEVRAAALARVESPCASERLRRLERHAGSGEKDALCVREAIRALGRCGGPAAFVALDHLLVDADLDAARRADAARELIDHHGEKGTRRVADVMVRTAELALQGRLVDLLQTAPASDRVIEALCEIAGAEPPLRAAVSRTLHIIAPDAPPCDLSK